MTNTNEQPAAAGNAPTHVAYQVREGKDKGFWNRIGVAWQHKDGKGFNVQLECVRWTAGSRSAPRPRRRTNARFQPGRPVAGPPTRKEPTP